ARAILGGARTARNDDRNSVTSRGHVRARVARTKSSETPSFPARGRAIAPGTLIALGRRQETSPNMIRHVGRIRAFVQITDLGAAIETNAKAIRMYPGKGYKDSGYPDCTISPAGAVGGDAACTSAPGQ